MGFKNREVEFKMQVTGSSKPAAEMYRQMRRRLSPNRILVGSSIDVYWSLKPFQKKEPFVKGDFVRVRCMEDGTGQITVKEQDRGTYVDRVEIDVGTKSPKEACELLAHMFGNPLGHIFKTYYVFFMEDDHTTVSLYEVHDDGRIFVEVEAKNLRRANQLLKEVLDVVEAELVPVNRSLYELVLSKAVPVPLSKIRLPMSENKIITPRGDLRVAARARKTRKRS